MMSITLYLENAVIHSLKNNPNIDFLTKNYVHVGEHIQDKIILLFLERQLLFTADMQERIMSKSIYDWLKPGEPQEQYIEANKMHKCALSFNNDFFKIQGYISLMKEVIQSLSSKDVLTFLKDIHIEPYLEDPQMIELLSKKISEAYLLNIPESYDFLSDDKKNELHSKMYDLLSDIDDLLTGCSDTIKKPFFTEVFKSCMTKTTLMKNMVLWNEGRIMLHYMINVIDDHMLQTILSSIPVELSIRFHAYEHLNKNSNLIIQVPHTKNLSDFVRLLKNLHPKKTRKIRIDFADIHLLNLLKEDMNLVDACFFCRFFNGVLMMHQLPELLPKFQYLEKFNINVLEDIVIPSLQKIQNNQSHELGASVFMPIAYRLYDALPHKDMFKLFFTVHPLNFGIKTGYYFDDDNQIVTDEVSEDINIELAKVQSIYQMWQNVIQPSPSVLEELPLFY